MSYSTATTNVDVAYLSRRPLPVAPTGYYDWEITTDPTDIRQGRSTVAKFINKIKPHRVKSRYKPTTKDLEAFLDTVRSPRPIDDRKDAFGAGLAMLTQMDPNTDIAKKTNDEVISALYNAVPRPPTTYLGATHCFREADGGGNNPDHPDIGRAGMAYGRSVQGKAGLPRTSLPDAGLVFDTILKRKGIKNHPGGMSSLNFAFASIITQSIFRTDPQNITINNTSSYLDLSPLYGEDHTAQDKVRDKGRGRGLLFPDTFSEDRLRFLPPATSVLLVLYSRNHNYIAEHLLKINERQIWLDPPPTDEIQCETQDEQIFQTARLVNCGHFMSAVMGDYLAGILGSSEGRNWNMDALDVINTKDLHVSRGLGNHVSVEFNLLYRWHATISEHDEKWTNDVFKSAFGDTPCDQLSLTDTAIFAEVARNITADPAERSFAGLKRDVDGKFSDDDLAAILHASTENSACTFGGLGNPPALRVVEIMGIEQARAWGVCTMNEFRRFLGLKEYETFEEWNPDPEIAGAAQRLYGHVNNLELYTGLQAEATMPLMHGSRLACGYTITRAILIDVISLIRGDRFYTTDFTPSTLTTWGFHDCQREMNNGGLGGAIPKLLLRHLPRHFSWNSVYSLFPFFTPVHMKESLTRQGLADRYNFDSPEPLPVPKILSTFNGIQTVFNDPEHFKVIYQKQGYGSVMVFDENPVHDKDRAMLVQALFPDQETLKQYTGWINEAVTAKIQEKTWTYRDVEGNYVDIIRDVINAVSCHFAADKLTGIPLKTKDNPRGLFTEGELFDMLTTLFTANFLTFDEPENAFALNEAAIQAKTIIAGLIAKSISEISSPAGPGILGNLRTRASSLFWTSNRKPWYPFLSRVIKRGRPIEELLDNIIGLAVGASVHHAHAAANVVDFYLDDARAKEKEHIIALIKKEDKDSVELLRRYVCEAMRLKPQFTGLWRRVMTDTAVYRGPELEPLEVKAGDLIWGSFKNAHLNPLDFPNPMAINLHRPYSSYNLNGTGFHSCPGTEYSIVTIAEVVKVVFALKNVRRAPGDAGKLHGYTDIIRETETDFYVQRDGTIARWPGSMCLVYDL